jgi:hypothetical protein
MPRYHPAISRGEYMADFFLSVAPYLGATGAALTNLDEDRTGGDDFAGELLMYAGYVIASVTAGEDIPPVPDTIKAGTTDKISGVARVSLIVANSLLTVAQFQVAGKAGKILRYINQAIQSLLAGAPVPAAPKI